jgi:hypothetical protein
VRGNALLVAMALGLGSAANANAQGFAALVSPPRFEMAARAGQTLRSTLEISNRSTAATRYRVHTADWTLSRDFSVQFQDELLADSCRPWVSIERPEILVPGGATMRYRFEVSVPPGVSATECRFGILIEGSEPSIAQSSGLQLPVTGRIGVIVYVTVGDAAPILEVFGTQIVHLNGQDVPTLRLHNSGNAHGRVSGFLTGTDAKGVSYDFTPSDFPILPHEERELFLTPSNGRDEHPTLTFPVTVKGTLEWGNQRTELDQLFE